MSEKKILVSEEELVELASFRASKIMNGLNLLFLRARTAKRKDESHEFYADEFYESMSHSLVKHFKDRLDKLKGMSEEYPTINGVQDALKLAKGYVQRELTSAIRKNTQSSLLTKLGDVCSSYIE